MEARIGCARGGALRKALGCESCRQLAREIAARARRQHRALDANGAQRAAGGVERYRDRATGDQAQRAGARRGTVRVPARRMRCRDCRDS